MPQLWQFLNLLITMISLTRKLKSVKKKENNVLRRKLPKNRKRKLLLKKLHWFRNLTKNFQKFKLIFFITMKRVIGSSGYSFFFISTMFETQKFIVSAFSLKDLPKKKLPEVVLCGRSNVGKSSL